MWNCGRLELRNIKNTRSVIVGREELMLAQKWKMESPFKPTVVKGKVALITGGGSGIGYAITRELGKHGAAVAIMGRRKHAVDAAAAALQSEGIQAIGLEADVRNKEDAARVVELTVKQFGRLDILVNCAAGNFLVSPEDLSPNGFRTVLDIDSVGTFTMCHAAFHYLKKGGPGKAPSEAGVILNISATVHYTAAWYQIHVSAAKAAVDSITRSLALEWGMDYEIRVNSIAPGPIEDTPGWDKLMPKEILEIAQSHRLLYRTGEKWDIAMAVIYLASDAGKYINGATLVVDGGHWLSHPRVAPKDTIRAISRVVEMRSRATKNAPKSKL